MVRRTIRLLNRGADPMPKDVLPPERMAAFNEFIWVQMGNLQTTAWHDLLDPGTARGAAVRAYYRHLLTASEDLLDIVPPPDSA